MNQQFNWLDAYLRAKPGAEYDYKEEWQWHRYQVRGKLFAALCEPEFKYQTYGGHPLINLKCDPRLSELLQAEHPEILPGFYSDKRHWIAVLLDGNLPEETLRQLCDASYDLVTGKLPKKVQRELGLLPPASSISKGKD